ncbi:arylsulfatase B-like isoform X1 [Haliotis rubra]|uniref:arylsulfatase B-like isoform X1 n=1 Tax=Haliotis rubra TaxID=36100 RepID=UPI001EE566D7|nr:arylsulfatase B-like isoform X1 [Haliotis rubra]
MDSVYLGLVLVAILLPVVISKPKQPHIVLIVADDLGWNDVGYHNPDMLTPNIDKLASEGVVMDNAYTQPLCSPTRAALMTGVFPYKVGLQHLVIMNRAAVCAPHTYSLLPEELKKLGYATHMVGKWHLGFCNWNCTPTYRGFDSFFGYFGSDEDHFAHTNEGYLDYRENTDPATEYEDVYSAYTFVDKATEVIHTHDVNQPLFLYVAMQNVHEPLQAPSKYYDMYPHVKNEGRRFLSAMASALDDAVGNVTKALKDKGIFEDTLILFLSDNGGDLENYGNNYPLRGGKYTIWEGGTRTICFMNGAGLKRRGHTFSGLIHAVDWKATLISAAGGILEDASDSIDHWEDIVNNADTRRTEFIYNLDDVKAGVDDGHAAIRYGDYKLIHGPPGRYDGWYTPDNSTNRTQLNYSQPLDLETPSNSYWLFNLKDDPYERKNLINRRHGIEEKLKKKLEEYHKDMVPANFPDDSDEADPELFDGVWSPGWC